MNQPQNNNHTAAHEQAIKLARESAFAHSHQHDYLPQTREEANHWQPHGWVITAIQAAELPSTPAAPWIDLEQFREAVLAQHSALMDSWCGDPETKEAADKQRDQLLALIDASHNGGRDALQITDTEGVREILGRMCLQYIRLAQVLRLRGDEIKERAEDEQAAVLRFLLNHYLASPDQWAELTQAEINAIRKLAQATCAEVGVSNG